MDWWLIPIGIGVVALLWVLWVAAFNPAEKVSALPDLDGYVPGDHGADVRSDDSPDTDIPPGDRPVAGPPSDSRRTNDPASKPADSDVDHQSAAATEPGATEGGEGIWIEFDITPLFPSSEHQSMIDLTEAEDSEPTG